MTQQPIGPDDYRLGREIADVVAHFAHLEAPSIFGVDVDGERVVIKYGVRTGSEPDAIRGRVRVLDARTCLSITDRWEA